MTPPLHSLLTVLCAMICLPACAGRNRPATPLALHLAEVFPGIRLDAESKVLDIAGRVATDVHDPQTPDVYLELLVCTPDTREYESLVKIDAKAEHVHAALLLLGLQPGHPGSWKVVNDGLVGVEPTGDPVNVTFIVNGRRVSPESWVVRAPDRSKMPPLHFVFAGSRFEAFQSREIYTAAIEGTVVGLTTFGTEIIAPTAMHNPETAVEPAAFLAKNDSIPPVNTPVTVRITPADEPRR